MRVTKIVLWAVAAGLFAIACQDDSQDLQDASQLSEYARNYLQMKSSPGLSSMASLMSPASPVNDSYSRLSGSGRISSGGREKGDSTKSDTTFIPSPWVSCAKVTETMNSDGSITITYDYGDGCEEGNEFWRYFMRGKYTYTYKSEVTEEGPLKKDAYFYAYKTDNYGGRYYFENDTIEWESNGNASYTGVSLYNTLTESYSGRNTSDFDDSYVYGEQEAAYKGHTKSYYNEKKYVIEESQHMSDFGDDYFHSAVLDPLVSVYDCNPYTAFRGEGAFCMYMPIYVSGREFIKYRQNGVEGSFLIDWGNGDCDSKFTIIENNKVVVIDMSKPEEIFAGK